MRKVLLILYISLAYSVVPIVVSAQNVNPLQVTCTDAGQAGTVTFTALPSGGQGNYKYSWIASGGVATSSPQNSNTSQYVVAVPDQTPESAVVTVTDGQSTASATCAATVAIIEPIVGFCSIEVMPENSNSPQAIGRTVHFKAMVGGGNGTYTYNWTGTDGLSGTTQNVVQTYTTTGLKTGSVTITSGRQSATLTCTANLTDVSAVTAPNQATLGGICAENDQTPSLEKPTIWQFTPEGSASSTSVSWSGDASGNGMSSQVQYTTAGLKTASVHATGSGETLDLSCQAIVSTHTDSIIGPSGCFIATAAWGTPDQPEVVALRKFRDDKLLTTNLGTNFVNFYYQNSPAVADVIRDNNPLKMLVRILLRPVVYVAQQLDK